MHYRKNPDFVRGEHEEPPKGLTLYPQWDYTGYAWGMVIDLTACVNCMACVIACQAENNIPWSGRSRCSRRRAMHWLRVDTYYEGDPRQPAAHYQPVPCMHCENAPCELVCPTQATNHSRDGLNEWSTTAASARATARITVPTKCGASTSCCTQTGRPTA